MKKKLAQRLNDISHRQHSVLYRVVICITTICILMVLMPIIYVWIGRLLGRGLTIPLPRHIELIVGGISGVFGLLLMMWTVWIQWSVGRGGPTPIAPTQQLITTGPYALCRNPMHFGGLFYVFAFGLIFDNTVTALICVALDMIFIMAYFKSVEEKELLLRFGEEYQRYKDKTSFLIPYVW